MRKPKPYLPLISHELSVPYTKKLRRIRVLLPQDYDNQEQSYPVVYLHDGQNVFYSKESFAGYSWKAIKAVKNHDDLAKMIIVGIDNDADGRLDEYSPFAFENTHDFTIVPLGDKYADFVVNVVKPFIDRNYRTKKEKEFQALVGSSLGGSITQHIALKYPDVFGKLGVFSTANFLFQEAFDNFISNGKEDLSNHKYFIQVGTNEGNSGDSSIIAGNISQLYIDSSLSYYRQLIERGVATKDIRLYVVHGGKHSETVWSKYFLICLRYFSEFWKEECL